MEGARSGNVLLRRARSRAADDPARQVPIVRGMIVAKAANQRTVRAPRALRDHGSAMAKPARAAVEDAERRLAHVARRALTVDEVAGLRGIEGEAAALYFSVFDHLIRREGDGFRFTVRSRRPPVDRIDACCRSSMPCWAMTAARRWRRTGWIRRWGFCTLTGRDGPVWRWT